MTLLEQVELVRPATLPEALAALAGPGARPLAGGTDLMNGLRLGATDATTVVDVTGVPELRVLDDGDPVRIGAAVTVRELRMRPGLPARLPALADAAALLGGRQIQAAATVGGNLCNASPAAELATPLLVLGATAFVAGANGERQHALAELWAGPGRTVLAPGELLVRLDLPAGLDATASAYQRLELRRSVDIALVSASCWLQFEHDQVVAARVAVGAVAPTPLLVPEAGAELVGLSRRDETAVAAACARAGAAASAAARPIDDIRASAEYRRAMTDQVVRRAVRRAIARGGDRR
jgi:carbon-monoxide dehydrogenase medium subunit